MNPLKDHVIIYDDECPLCNLYTGAFVNTGMLDKNGRTPFTKLDSAANHHIDWSRAGTEIALVNTKDNTVSYGIDSLFKIISNSYPIFAPLFKLSLFRFLMKQLYFFISYNRKAIMPGKVFEAESVCRPTMNVPWRIAVIVFAWIVTSLILTSYSALLFPLLPAGGLFREALICAGQIVFQGLVILAIKRDRLIYYIGNIMTISLGGALLLVPMVIAANWFNNPVVLLGWFMFVVMLMFMEHIRRTRILNLPWVVTATWVLYRLLVLLIIFQTA
jgi:predicted DCC family thiol-disulfide oxidoreductase YuxK